MKLNHLKKEIDRLSILLPLIKKVHGKEHPELLEINAQFSLVKKALNDDTLTKKHLDQFNHQITTLTDKFTLPKDACPAYKESFTLLRAFNHE